MCKHITVLLPNRPGQFLRVATVLGGENINILGHHLTSEGTFGILQLLASNHAHAYAVLKAEFKAYCSEGEVLLVRLRHIPYQHAKVLQHLAEASINVRNAYTVIGDPGDSLAVLEPDPPSLIVTAKEILARNGFTLIEHV